MNETDSLSDTSDYMDQIEGLRKLTTEFGQWDTDEESYTLESQDSSKRSDSEDARDMSHSDDAHYRSDSQAELEMSGSEDASERSNSQAARDMSGSEDACDRSDAQAARDRSDSENTHDKSDSQIQRAFSVKSEEMAGKPSIYLHSNFKAQSIVELICPALATMFVVTIAVNRLDLFRDRLDANQKRIKATEIDSSVDSMGPTEYFVKAVFSAVMFVGTLSGMSFAVFWLYKHKYYQVMYTWIYGSCALLLFFWFGFFLRQIFVSCNTPVDIFTFLLVCWNTGVAGCLGISGQGPKLLNSVCLVILSALMALLILYSVPSGALYFFLIGLIIWDAIAVLSPHGPQHQLIAMYNERQDFNTDALVYTTGMVWRTKSLPNMSPKPKTLSAHEMAESEPSNYTENSDKFRCDIERCDDGNQCTTNASFDEDCSVESIRTDTSVSDISAKLINLKQRRRFGIKDNDNDLKTDTRIGWNRQRRIPSSDEDTSPQRTSSKLNAQTSNLQFLCPEGEGLRIGLGDFIFFAVLIGEVSMTCDALAVVASVVALVSGLIVTLSALSVMRELAVPALPLPLLLGGLAAYGCRMVLSVWSDHVCSQQIFF